MPLRCADLKINLTNPETKKKLMRAQLKVALRNYFVEIAHKGDELAYLQSDCFVGERQDIDRKRKEPSTAKRKREFSEKANGEQKKKGGDAPKKKRAPMGTAVSMIF